MQTPKSMFSDEDEDIPMPTMEGQDDDEEEDSVEAARNTNNTTDQEAEQFLMLSDFDRTTKLFRAALTALGNNNGGAIATLNTLLKRSEVLDKEQKEVIVPLFGELKSLLTTSQEELKSFNKSAQQSLEAQIKDVIAKVDFSPIEEKVKAANIQILESTNALKTKADEIEVLANRVKKLSFFQTLKWLVAGAVCTTVLMYGFFSYREAQTEQKFQAEYDAKIQAMETRAAVWKNLKDDQWGASIVDISGIKHIQLVVRDNSNQINLGRSFTTPDDKGKKFPVTFVNIPIFK